MAFCECMSCYAVPRSPSLSGVPPLGYRAQDRKLVIIDSEAEIVRSIILPGVSIGDDALIGAASVVTRDVPAGATAFGNPARALTPTAC